MARLNSLWIGPRLSLLEQVCVRSFLERGHAFRLYAYQPIENVPPGCEIADASVILAENTGFTYASGPGQGSFAPFSNVFRYELLYRQGGWWVDMDVICLTATLPEADIVLGRQDAELVNGAVLRFPPHHPTMRAALDECSRRLSDLQWGGLGPYLLTDLVASEHLAAAVLETPVFYPIHFSQFWALYDPRRTGHALQLIRNSACVHLWNEMIRRSRLDKDILPPPGSVLRGFYESMDCRHVELEYQLAPACPQNALQLVIQRRMR